MRLLLLLLSLPLLHTAGAAVIYGPVPYRGRLDSPFFEGIRTGDIFVEDLEDWEVNTPGLSLASPFAIERLGGVDEEEGRLDGLAIYGIVLKTTAGMAGGVQPPGPDSIKFDIRFSPGPDGRHPLYAGLALLGYAFREPGIESYSLFNAWDGAGNLLTPEGLRIQNVLVDLAPRLGSTIGDQFFGLYSETGISRILLQRKTTIDHIQYGWAIPEPGSGVLLLAAGALAARRRAAAGTRLA